MPNYKELVTKLRSLPGVKGKLSSATDEQLWDYVKANYPEAAKGYDETDTLTDIFADVPMRLGSGLLEGGARLSDTLHGAATVIGGFTGTEPGGLFRDMAAASRAAKPKPRALSANSPTGRIVEAIGTVPGELAKFTLGTAAGAPPIVNLGIGGFLSGRGEGKTNLESIPGAIQSAALGHVLGKTDYLPLKPRVGINVAAGLALSPDDPLVGAITGGAQAAITPQRKQPILPTNAQSERMEQNRRSSRKAAERTAVDYARAINAKIVDPISNIEMTLQAREPQAPTQLSAKDIFTRAADSSLRARAIAADYYDNSPIPKVLQRLAAPFSYKDGTKITRMFDDYLSLVHMRDYESYHMGKQLWSAKVKVDPTLAELPVADQVTNTLALGQAAYARRVRSNQRPKRPTKFTGPIKGERLENIENGIADFERDYPQFAQEAPVIHQYSADLLDKKVANGTIAASLRDQLRTIYPHYVPAHGVVPEIDRLFDAPHVSSRSRSGGKKDVASIGKQTAIQKFKGDKGGAIERPSISLQEYTETVFSNMLRNQAAKATALIPIKVPEMRGDIGRASPTKPPNYKDTTHFEYLEDGKPMYVEAAPYIIQAVKHFTPSQLNLLTQAAAMPARLTRLTATGISLPFSYATNVVRDTLTSFLNSTGFGSINPIQQARAAKSAFTHDPTYESLRQGGAGFTSNIIARNEPTSTVDLITALAAPRTPAKVGRTLQFAFSKPTDGTSYAKHLVRGVSDLTSIAENLVGRGEEMGRIRVYNTEKQRLIEAGATPGVAHIKALNASSNQQMPNYTRNGEWMRAWNAVIPFLNAGIQGTKMNVQRAQEAPASLAGKFALMGVAAATATVWNLSDDKRRRNYLDLADYERTNHLLLTSPNPKQDEDGKWNTVKIPLPEGFKGPVNMWVRAIEDVYNNDPEMFAQLQSKLTGVQPTTDDQPPASLTNDQVEPTPQGNPLSLLPSSIANFLTPSEPTLSDTLYKLIPGYARTAMDVRAQQDSFSKRPWVPLGMRDLPPTEQYIQGVTPGYAKRAGQALGISPMVLSNTVESLAGGGSSPVMSGLIDRSLFALGAIPREEVGGRSLKDAFSRRIFAAGGALDKRISEQERAVRDNAMTSFLAELPTPIRTEMFTHRVYPGPLTNHPGEGQQEYILRSKLRGRLIANTVGYLTSKPEYASLSTSDKRRLLQSAQSQANRMYSSITGNFAYPPLAQLTGREPLDEKFQGATLLLTEQERLEVLRSYFAENIEQ